MVRSQDEATLTIAGLAAAAAVGVETVRYYQRRGLLDVPERSGGTSGIRRYGATHVRRLRFIRAGQAAGFTLDQIDELLALDATQDRGKAHALATARIAALDAKIAALEEARASLRHLAEQCAGSTVGPCPILASFERPPHAAEPAS